MIPTETLATVDSLPDEVLVDIFHRFYHDQDRYGAGYLLKSIQRFQKVAAVCQRWRFLSLPLFCQRAVVYVETDEEYMDFDAYTDYKSSPAFNPKSNIQLILDLKRDDWVKEVVVSVHGLLLSPDVSMHAMKLVGFNKTSWLSAKKLRFIQRVRGYEDEDDFGSEILDKFNEFLSLGLPSLSEIEYEEMFCNMTYRQFPINALVNEHIGGPTPLRSLKVFADVPPAIHHYLGLPINIARLHIDGVNFLKPLQLPPILASSLEELTLSSVSPNRLWNMFVPASDGSGQKQSLVFARLRSLTLVFYWESEFNRAQINASRSNYTFDDSDDSDNDNDSDSDSETNNTSDDGGGDGDGSNDSSDSSDSGDDDIAIVVGAESTSYMQSSSFGTPVFPNLSKLEIRRFPKNLQEFLTLFTQSPVSSLIIAGLKSELPISLSFSSFKQLEKLEVRYIVPFGWQDTEYIEGSMQNLFTTPPESLQSISLTMETSSREFIFPNNISFAFNLRSLSLLVTVDMDIVAQLLRKLPVLWDLTLENVRVEPVVSNAKLLERLKSAETGDLAPVNRSLRRLVAPELTKLTDASDQDHPGVAARPDSAKEHLKLYRGLLLLVVRLPSLFMLRTSNEVAKDVERTVSTLVKSGVAAQFTEHLGDLSIKPWW